ncbi:DUF805 domain-containing protein [Sphingomonas sp.]|jgi:uncharacterized membrane protein YhaH (DUF805 family)|uniref:DUF805 domain-containing protein n=1 Tax=Sphingomonas sp. TaxID=28214 RepID=UPI002E347AF6|nr:DUF805 domain-containing protein [Sphingomonas sp.]HEX4694776.1 DUF805 domain-containing protein [Sphingomonas sp.]
MEWMFMPLKRYAEFSGRSRRMEYWMWVLFVCIVYVVLSLLDSALGLGGKSTATQNLSPNGVSYNYGIHGGILTGLFALATLIPNIAVAVRRLHDTNRTGWWLLLPLVPVIVGVVMMMMGAMSLSLSMVGLGSMIMMLGGLLGIVLIVFYCLPGTPGPNKYGPDPLGGGANLNETFA